MLEFKEIKGRVIKQLCSNFPALKIKPVVQKSNLRSLYKLVECQSIRPEQIKAVLQSPSEQQIESAKETLGKTEQLFTTYVNILEHNEKIRQKYELLTVSQSAEKTEDSKQMQQLIRKANAVSCKSQFVSLLKENGEKIFNQSVSTSPLKSSQGSSVLEIKEIYLPFGAQKLKSNVRELSEDEYLMKHEEIVQFLLIYVNRINKTNKQLSQMQGKAKVSTEMFELLQQLMSESLFRLQDNQFTQTLNFQLNYVRICSQQSERHKRHSENLRKQLSEATLRSYYIIFMVRNELSTVKEYVLKTNKDKKARFKNIGLLGDATEIQKEKEDLLELRQRVKEIADYLCDKEERVFKTLYQRKIKKAMIELSEVSDAISRGIKLNKRAFDIYEEAKVKIEKSQKAAEQIRQEQEKVELEKLKKQQADKEEQQRFIKRSKQTLNHEVAGLKQSVEKIEAKTSVFCKGVQSLSPKQDIPMSEFKELLKEVQALQIIFHQISNKQNKFQESLKKAKRNNTKKKLLMPDSEFIYQKQLQGIQSQLGSQILELEIILIDAVKAKIKRNGDDISSKFGGLSDNASQFSYSSEISEAGQQPNPRIKESEVILEEVSPKQPTGEINYESFMKESISVIKTKFIPNMDAFCCVLEDMENSPIQSIQDLLFIYQNYKEQVLMPEQAQKIEEEKKQTNQSPKKPKKPKKPTKEELKQKEKEEAEKKVAEQKRQQNTSIAYQQLSTLKNLLLPRVSQRLIHKVFNGDKIQTEIFTKIYQIIHEYRQRLVQPDLLENAKKCGFYTFAEKRLNYVSTILRSLEEFSQIFKFIRQFSEEKIRLDPTTDKTYDLILKALLAEKEVEIYKNNLKALSEESRSAEAVDFLHSNIYEPFQQLFQNMMKVYSNNMPEELALMLEHCRVICECRAKVLEIAKNLQNKNEGSFDTIQVQQLQKELASRVNKFAIFRYKRTQALSNVLKKCLQLSREKEGIHQIKKLLSEKLLQAELK